MSVKAWRIDKGDNVAVAVANVQAGQPVYCGDVMVEAKDNIATGHKIALEDIPEGGAIHKYGVCIGVASVRIARGSHVHTHNVRDITGLLCEAHKDEYMARVGEA